MRTRARRGAVWWLYGGSVVGGSGVAHEVVNGGEMVQGWGDQPTGEWSALGSLSREAGSASARPGPGLEGVSGTAQQAGAGKAGGLDLGWPSRWPSTEAGRTGITRYAITSQLRPGSMNYPSLCNHCIDTPDWESPVQPLCKKLGCCHGFFLVAPPALPYRQTRWRGPRLTAATCTAVPSSMAHRSIAFIMSAEGDWSDVTMSALFMRGIGEPSHPPRRPKLGFTEKQSCSLASGPLTMPPSSFLAGDRRRIRLSTGEPSLPRWHVSTMWLRTESSQWTLLSRADERTAACPSRALI